MSTIGRKEVFDGDTWWAEESGRAFLQGARTFATACARENGPTRAWHAPEPAAPKTDARTHLELMASIAPALLKGETVEIKAPAHAGWRRYRLDEAEGLVSWRRTLVRRGVTALPALTGWHPTTLPSKITDARTYREPKKAMVYTLVFGSAMLDVVRIPEGLQGKLRVTFEEIDQSTTAARGFQYRDEELP